MPVREQPARSLAGGGDGGDDRGGRALYANPIGQRAQLVGEFACARLVRRQRGAHRVFQLGGQRGPAVGQGRCTGAWQLAERPRRRAARRGLVIELEAGVDLLIDGAVALPAGQQLAHALLQAMHVAAAGLEHVVQALVLAAGGPDAAVALQSAREPLDRLRPGLGPRGTELGHALHRALQRIPLATHQRGGHFLAQRRVVAGPCGEPFDQRAGLVGQRRRRGAMAALFGPGAGVVLGRGLQPREREAAQCRLGDLGRGERRDGGVHQPRTPLIARADSASAGTIHGALRGSTVSRFQRSRSSAGIGRLNR
jgi:hypothetical protein